MLAFADDAALFRVMLGATAVPAHRRSAWLRRVAAVAEGQSIPPRSKDAVRAARARQRRRNGCAVYRIEIDRDALVLGMILSGRLDERAALDHAKVETAAASVLKEWAVRWKKSAA
jgi:hypothetical protein